MAFYKKSININKQKISAQPKRIEPAQQEYNKKKEQKAKMENGGKKEENMKPKNVEEASEAGGLSRQAASRLAPSAFT